MDSSAPQSARDMHVGAATAAPARWWPTTTLGPSLVLMAAARQFAASRGQASHLVRVGPADTQERPGELPGSLGAVRLEGTPLRPLPVEQEASLTERDTALFRELA